MDYVLIAIIVILLVREIVKSSKGRKYGRRRPTDKPSNQSTKAITNDTTVSNSANYIKSYKRKYVLTTNEKDAFRKIKAAADLTGYTVLSKVRLFDLIEPLNKTDKGAQWKIQAKHVDFVLCDKSLVARYIIELGDKSHEKADRIERDAFVLTVLRNCGYSVLITNNIDTDRLVSWIREQEQAKKY